MTYLKSISLFMMSCSLIVGGCTTQPTQEQSGMVIGGILGGALGSQVGGGQGSTAAAVLGAILGGAIGGSVGRSMDENDRLKVGRTLETVQTGVASQWRNPDTGNQYSVVPTRTYETEGRPCREYTLNGVIGGKKDQIIGTACRQADGSWRAIN